MWKYPVAGPQTVRTLNIDGDGQGDLAGHGGPHRAVMVYQLDSYHHWSAHFDRKDFQYGQFGENFTVDGLPDDEVCVGDRYAIGDALFEVSQPRVTCYRVGLRLGEPQLPALLVSHRRPGFYLRVLREGTVRAGDPMIKVLTGPERMTVAEIDALLYLPGHDRRDVARALAVAALSPGWQASFKAILADGSATGNAGLVGDLAPPAAWPGFREFRVVGIDRVSESVISLDAGGGGRATAARRAARPIRRDPGTAGRGSPRGHPQLLVVRRARLARVPDQRQTRTRRRGQRLPAHQPPSGHGRPLAAPRGAFVLREGNTPVVLLSAGIGATPVLAMLYALETSGSERAVWWLHGARNSREHPFSAETRDLLAQLRNGRSHIYYSAPLSTDQQGRDYEYRGRLTGSALAGLDIPTDADAYICGPQPFMDDMRSGLIDLGLDPARVSTEIFGSRPAITPGIVPGAAPVAPHQPPGRPGSGAEVTFARSGLTVPWRPDFGSLLDLAEACDVPVQWSCRTGICHTCETALLAGSVNYSPEPIDPAAEGSVLVCCAAPSEEVVVDL